MSFTDGATKKSLFVQVAWFDQYALNHQLEHVRLHHRDRTKDDYIHNIVLDEIGNPYGLHDNLSVIAPYLPGGYKKAFDNVFVGSNYIPYQGQGSSYSAGMVDSGHRWANLSVQADLWKMFRNSYSNVPFHFYINHEGVLDYFDIPEIRAGYEAYLIQSVRDAHRVKPNRAVLWSPAIWSGKPLTSSEEIAIGKTFRHIEEMSKVVGHYGGIKWLHFQDMMGRGRRDITKYDVKRWYNELKSAYNWDSLRVNMEMFNQPAWRIRRREDWYQRNGVAVGSSWELRTWYPTHKEL